MKQTYNINISGYGFVIDDDAYEMLRSYLDTLEEICKKADEHETAVDIEQRIAEIFTERFKQTGPRIISRPDVEDVISRMGMPEEIMDVEIEEKETGEAIEHKGAAATPPPVVNFTTRKRLYRDIDNKVFGGVCSGIGWYIGIDPVWIRIAMVALTFLSASTLVIIYVILWVVIPPAKSPYERMQMMGIDSSMRNVGKVVKGEYKFYPPNSGIEGDKRKNSTSSGATIGKLIQMIFIVIGLLISGSLLVLFSVGFMGCLIAVCVTNARFNPEIDVVAVKLILGCILGGILVLGIPLFMLFRSLLASLTERSYSRFTPGQRLLMIIPWLIGVGVCITCGILLGSY